MLINTLQGISQCSEVTVLNYSILPNSKIEPVDSLILAHGSFDKTESIWDVDGNGIRDLVAVPNASSENAVYLILLNEDKSAKSITNIITNELLMEINVADNFGACIEKIGDLNGDGLSEIAIGAPGDSEDDSTNAGALYILFLDSAANINSYSKIGTVRGGIEALFAQSFFGTSVCSMGDLNSDGINDIMVGATFNGTKEGMLYLLHLTAEGNVESQITISEESLGIDIPHGANFGSSIVCIGDIDGNGYTDLAVGASKLSNNRRSGGIYMLLFRDNWNLSSHKIITRESGGIGDDLTDEDFFGNSLDTISDINGDDRVELISGSTDGTFDTRRGAVWILMPDETGYIAQTQKIRPRNFQELETHDKLGSYVNNLGDLDNDGITELSFGALEYNISSSITKAVFISNICENYREDTVISIGDVRQYSIIGGDSGDPLSNLLEGGDFLDEAIPIWDVDSNGIVDIILAAQQADYLTPEENTGTIFKVLLQKDFQSNIFSVKQAENLMTPELHEELSRNDFFGSSIENIGDLDGDGYDDLAIGANGDNDKDSAGAIYIVFLDSLARVKKFSKISPTRGNFDSLPEYSAVGYKSSIRKLGDVNNDGVNDLLVGAPTLEKRDGRLYVLHLKEDGTVKSHIRLDSEKLGYPIPSYNCFGSGLATIGDINHDGINDFAVGASVTKINGAYEGEIVTLLMNEDWTLKAPPVEISSATGAIHYDFGHIQDFGEAFDFIPDMDGDGINEIIAGVRDDDYGMGIGSVWIFFLDSAGVVKNSNRIPSTVFKEIGGNDRLGSTVRYLGDLDNNGTVEIGIGAYRYGLNDKGGIFITNVEGGMVTNRHRYIAGSVYADSELVVGGIAKLLKDGVLLDSSEIQNGHFRFNSIDPGKYYITLYPSSNYSEFQNSTIQCDVLYITDSLILLSHLTPKLYSIEGTVTADNIATNDALIELYENNFEPKSFKDTAYVQNGTFKFDSLRKGTYRLIAQPLHELATYFEITNYPWEITLLGVGNIGGINIELEKLSNYTTISNEFYIYPNPTKFDVHVICSEYVSSLELLSSEGYVLLKSIPLQPNNETTINISHLPEGVYFLKASTQSGYFVEKVLLQR